MRSYKATGDLKVLGELYARYMDLVFGVCLKYLDDTELSKDATMQIFEELIAKVMKHDVQVFRAWLYTLARNHCLMKLRSSKNKRVIPFDGSFVQSEDSVHRNDAMEWETALTDLESCIETLKADQQQVVKLFYLQEKSYNEIVAETSLEWNLVRSLVQNGRRNLKICMEKKITIETRRDTRELRIDQ